MDALLTETIEDNGILMSRLEATIGEARDHLKSMQAEDGHWVFDLEADATIPAEFILLNHYLDEIDEPTEAKLAAYLRATQGDHGGWPLFYGGDFNISASVKAYFALKLVGDSPDAPHMQRARDAILAEGGAARANVFSRITLALFGQVPWRAVPVMPVEIMLLPTWFPFHLSKISYWSRTVLVPLLILMALKPQAKNPRGVQISELFHRNPEEEEVYLHNPTGSTWGEIFLGIDKVLRKVEPMLPRSARDLAIKAAVKFIKPRLNGEDGLGGIFPAMANTVMAFEALGYPKDNLDLVTAKNAIQKLLRIDGEKGFCQPCLSPIWDTGLALHSMAEANESDSTGELQRAASWLAERQILDVEGDWIDKRPGLRPGGWPFEYANDYYPDVDDTAVVALALDRMDSDKFRENIDRAAEWIVGMQSKNGGWGSFDADNTYGYLNHIPFADHGALLDPPTADVTARCIGMLAQLDAEAYAEPIRRGVAYLKADQEEDGSWFGRWGTNYIYGTWSVLCALNAAGEDMNQHYITKAVNWLKDRQGNDGGWGEDGATYWEESKAVSKASTASQTAWAVLALMAAGETDGEHVERGVKYLLESPRNGSTWEEPWYTAVGFPKVFYLKYHGYNVYFPLWALARYRNLKKGNTGKVPHGI
jgi:squalene-hopene/tetraprenyl-beta-curcumene cyclase